MSGTSAASGVCCTTGAVSDEALDVLLRTEGRELGGVERLVEGLVDGAVALSKHRVVRVFSVWIMVLCLEIWIGTRRKSWATQARGE